MGPMYRATVSVTQFMIPDEILWRIAVYWPDLGNHWHEAIFFFALCCLGKIPGGAPFSQRSEQATACTNRMQIRN